MGIREVAFEGFAPPRFFTAEQASGEALNTPDIIVKRKDIWCWQE
jgi:hypothetical protein